MEVAAAHGDVVMAEEYGCSTPKRGIPARTAPPPPPCKKHLRDSASGKREPPKNGYFHPPDLEQLFALRPRHETCA